MDFILTHFFLSGNGAYLGHRQLIMPNKNVGIEQYSIRKNNFSYRDGMAHKIVLVNEKEIYQPMVLHFIKGNMLISLSFI